MNVGELGPVNVCCGAYPGHRDHCTAGDMTEAAERGAEAYRQAYRHIEAGGLCRTAWGRRRTAMRYLRFTASPPLTPAEQEAATDAMRRMRSMTRRDLVILAVVLLIFAGAIAIAHSPIGSWRLP